MSRIKSIKKQLLAVSPINENESNLTIAEAVSRWSYFEHHHEDDFFHCQLCGSRMKKFVILKHTSKKDVFLKVGSQCHRKLEHYKKAGEWKAVSQADANRAIKVAIQKEEETFYTYIKWFLDQDELPEHLKQAAKCAQDNGYVPSNELACELVEYYRNHKLFPVRHLFKHKDWVMICWLRFKGQDIPDELTIAQAEIIRGYFEAEYQLHPELKQYNTLHEEIALRCIARVNGEAPNPVFHVNPNNIHLDQFVITVGSQSLKFPIELMFRTECNWQSLLQALKDNLPKTIKLKLPNKNEPAIDNQWLKEWLDIGCRVTRMKPDAPKPPIEKLLRAAYKRKRIKADLVVKYQTKREGITSFRHIHYIEVTVPVDDVVFRIPALLSKAVTLKNKFELDREAFIQIMQEAIPKEYQLAWPLDDGIRFTEIFENAWCNNAMHIHQKQRIALELQRKENEEKKAKQKKLEKERQARLQKLRDQFINHADIAKQQILMNRKDAFELPFFVGYNPKSGKRRWEHRDGVRTYILSRQDFYDFGLNRVVIFCQIVRTLVSDKVY